MATRAGVNVIVPDHLYQRGNFLNWPYAQKWALLNELGVTCVVNLWHRVDPDLSSPKEGNIYLTWHCSPSRVPPEADDMVGLVTRLMFAGHVVMVHCEAGRGRSVWFSTRLLAEFTGMTREQAYELVKDRVPGHNLTPALEADLA